jgi:hypothetical protein
MSMATIKSVSVWIEIVPIDFYDSAADCSSHRRGVREHPVADGDRVSRSG